jgi:hypothetical protein
MDARVPVLGLRRSKVHLRLIDCSQPSEPAGLGEREGQAAGAAADFEHLFAIRDAGMLDKERRQASAPAPHQPFVISRIAGVIDSRHTGAFRFRPMLCANFVRFQRRAMRC